MNTGADNFEGAIDTSLDDLEALLDAQYNIEPLHDFTTRISPRLPPPPHLNPLRELFAEARQRPVQALISIPPRHAKTTTIQHALAWLLHYDPALEHAYISAGADFARDKSVEMQRLAAQAGVDYYGPASNWRTQEGGRLRAMGVGGQYAGTGTTGLQVVDDPYPTAEKALNARFRERVWTFWTGTAANRREPGSSAIICHHRWHEDDLIGRLLREEPHKWRHINLPAVADFDEDAALRRMALEGGQRFDDDWVPTDDEIGRPLWPGYWPIRELLPKMRYRYYWHALYMGQPRPQGERLFGEPARFNLDRFRERNGRLKLDGYRAVIAVDPAATAATKADYSAIVVLAMQGYGEHARGYVVHVERHQVDVPTLCRRLVALQSELGLLTAVEAVGGFKAVPQTMKAIAPSLRVHGIQTASDKFVRAQPAAAAWRVGRLLVPYDHQALWVPEYLPEMQAFTGVEDAADDQVDATCHAYNVLYRSVQSRPRGAVPSQTTFG